MNIKTLINKNSEEILLMKRACSLVRKLSPGYLEMNLLRAFLNALTPYIAIYMSALIIDELVGHKNLSVLLLYVLISVGGTAFITIINAILTKKISVLDTTYIPLIKNYLNNKLFSVDYALLENPEYTETHSRIINIMFVINGGMASVIRLLSDLVNNFISLITAIIILITSSISISAQNDGFNITSFLLFLLTLAVIILSVFITARNSKIVSEKQYNLAQNTSTNNYLNYYHYNYMEDDKAAKDIRIFDQKKLIINEVISKGRLPWMKVLLGQYSLYQKYYGINILVAALVGGYAYIYIGLQALAGLSSLGSITKSYASITMLNTTLNNLFIALSQIKSNNKYLKSFFDFIDIPVKELSVNKKHVHKANIIRFWKELRSSHSGAHSLVLKVNYKEHNSLKDLSCIEDAAYSVSVKKKHLHTGSKIPEKNIDKCEIEFHNVSFRYPNSRDFAVKNISMKIASNNRIAIVGMNGSGKSTMIKLLCGLYQPDEGFITYNGKNIREYAYDEYLKLFSVVFQDFKLFSLPIGENIAASKDYDAEKAWQSLKIAGSDEFVKKLPLNMKQYIYKYVDEAGIDLSGGEEQKLAIARANYKDASFIILDEPTAALDPVAEYNIYNRLNEIINKKAAVFISHRLSSCKFCDTIIVLDKGKIIQKGDHATLLKESDGKYYELWNAQAQYYK
jgi:ATP-binding cassette subfamily B protein